jgi:tetratricopeptide (TPR) repeat protein
MERYEEALADFDRAIGLDPNQPWIVVSRGETYRLIERYEEALADFDRAIGLDPNQAWIVVNRGETYRLIERYEEALADFDRAIELDPEYGWAIAHRGETYLTVERYDEALADFDRAIELDPNNVTNLARRGEIYLISGSYLAGKADLDRAIEINPEFEFRVADHLVYPAVAHLKKGELEVAAAMFEAVISTFPNSANAHNNYAFCLLPVDPDRALGELKIADKLLPNRLVTTANEMLAFHLLGRDAEALALGYSDKIITLPAESALMWDIDDSHVLHLRDSGDVAEYLRILLTHIEQH